MNLSMRCAINACPDFPRRRVNLHQKDEQFDMLVQLLVWSQAYVLIVKGGRFVCREQVRSA